MPFDKNSLEKWRTAKEERQKTALLFLEKNGFILENVKGSHFTFKHPLLSEIVRTFPGYAHELLKTGILTIVCHDNKVYAPYLKRIVSACELMEEYEAVRAAKGESENDEKGH